MDGQNSAEAYIPVDRRLAMVKQQDLPSRTQGTALFADISGFTPLTEAMARELGPRRGAEEVTRQLNLVYTDLISQVDRYHGSVISFSGDALTCWFDSDDGRRAFSCAYGMQKAMRNYASLKTPTGTSISLKIKISITAGPVRRFRVGDPEIQYIDVLAGRLLDRLAAGEHQATTGEILASAEVVANLETGIQIKEWRQDHNTGDRFAVVDAEGPLALDDPWQMIPPGRLGEEQVRPWVLAPVFERIKTGQGQFLAELRPTASLFLCFTGIDYDHEEDAGKKLDAYIRWVQQVASRYEGYLVQLTFGDKGSYLYCTFGAPIAHDDDPVRAVSAALELLTPPDYLSVNGTHIGVSQGTIRAGPYGGITRCIYGAMGDEVNTAARLMSRAEPGQILVTDRVAESLSGKYQMEVLGPVSVKGKKVPILISRVIAHKQAASNSLTHRYANAMVGREAELATVQEMLARTLTGKGQLLRIEGEAGIGKSRLATELINLASHSEMQAAIGVCQSITQNTAYAPWRQVVRTLLGIENKADAEMRLADLYAEQIRKIEGFIQRTKPDWMLRFPLLGDLLGLPVPENATTAAFEPKLRQSALFDLITEIIQYLARSKPLLILLDDVHWMDEVSQNLTIAVGRSINQAPILLALVHRPATSGMPILPDLNSLSHQTRLFLGELSSEGISTLLANRLGGKANGLALSFIQFETQGNPFFVEELANTLLESGSLYRNEEGEWALSELLFQALQKANCLVQTPEGWQIATQANLSEVDLGIPDSIQGVVLARIDRLPEAHKLTLKVASVIGRIFALNVLTQAHPLRLDSSSLLGQVQYLEERDFTRQENPSKPVYMFKHAVTHDVAYDTLLFDQRRQLHREVGEAIEHLTPEAIDQIAYHSFIGEDWQRAFHYHTAAGNKSQKLFANREGIEHYQRALLAAENIDRNHLAVQLQQIHASLGELLATTGQYDQARDQLDKALEAGQALGDLNAQAKACRWIAYLYELRSDYPSALEWIEKGLKLLESRKTTSSAELMAIAGLIYVRQGNYDRANELCDRSMQLAEEAGDPTSLAFASNSRAIVAFSHGDMPDAICYFEQAAELYQQAGNIHGQALSYNGMGNSYQNMGKWPEAYGYLRQAEEIFNQTGDELHRGFANNNLGEIARKQGRLDDALGFYQKALQILEQLGSSAYVVGVLQMNIGATHIRRQEANLARQYLQASRDNYNQAGARDFLPELYRYDAEASMLAGDPDAAKIEGERSLDLARKLGMRSEEGMSLRILGMSEFELGDFPAAEAHLYESVNILKEVKHEFDAACSQRELAQVYLAQEKTEQADDLLAQCIQVFERLGAVLELEATREVMHEAAQQQL